MNSIKSIGVVGAGQMGAGIAQVSAMAGFVTRIWDLNPDSVSRGIKTIEKSLAKFVEKEKISVQEQERALKNINKVSDISEMQNCDLVVEAVVESFEAKSALFKKLDGMLNPEGLLASNTSSISITKIAGITTRPDRVIGMHFMNPVPLMKLVEIIPGLQTSVATVEIIKHTAEKMGKTCVNAKDSAGFTVNRILVPMVNEAMFLVQEGNDPQDIDQAMVLGTNQPMGPLALADLVGLDTLLFIAQVLHRELGEDKYRPCPLLVKYVEAGWLGRKTKRGFYTYE